MDNIQCGRELLKKSIHMATYCPTCKDVDQEKKIWKIACNYIKRAQELIPNSEWSALTALEKQILESGVPHLIQSTFYNTDNETNDHRYRNKELSDSEPPVPVPSTWRKKLQDLNQQIRVLQTEKEKLEEYKHAAQTLKSECEYLEQKHENYKQRAIEEQSQLQQEIKKMIKELEDLGCIKDDSHHMELEMKKLREKIIIISNHNREEMGRLCTELDTSQYERSVLSTTLQQTQQHVLELTSQVQTLETQISKYQEIFQSLLPTMTAEQQNHLQQILSIQLQEEE